MFGCAAIALCVTGCDLSLEPTDKAQSKKGSAPKAKQNMQNKIQNIQQRKNKEMEDALK